MTDWEAMRQYLDEHARAEWMVITKEIAEEMLTHNTDNPRNLKRHVVKAYTDAIASGAWRITGDTIVFNDKGVLLNGQHRLTGVVKSGQPIICLVVKGLPDNKVYDIGAQRTVTDILRNEGYQKTNTTIVGAVNAILFDFGMGGSLDKTGYKVRQYIKRNINELTEAYEITLSHRPICRKASVVAAIFSILVSENGSKENIRAVIESANTGLPAPVGPVNPGLLLRMTLQDVNNKWDRDTRKLAYDATYQAYLDYSSGYERKKKYKLTDKSEKLLTYVKHVTGA
jgi:hypothetical protein